MSNMTNKTVVILNGTYKGCEADIFGKGMFDYFRDDELNCDIKFDDSFEYVELIETPKKQIDYLKWRTMYETLSLDTDVTKTDVLDILDSVITNQDFLKPVEDFFEENEIEEK